MHEVVQAFPDFEKYDLADQMRRASKSVPANMMEGFALRESIKELKRHLRSAMASANEMEAHIEIAHDLGYITAEVSRALVAEYQVIGKQLNMLIQNWRSFR